MYDAHGRKVQDKGSKRGLVDPILDHFNVNAANPLAVLTQDSARTFLSAKGSVAEADQAKYKLFHEATLLAEFQRNLVRAGAVIDKTKRLVEEHEVRRAARGSKLLGRIP